jgi:hypothetical protein
MSKEINKNLDVQPNPVDFQEMEKAWNEGEVSSEAFMPVLIHKLLQTNHLIWNGQTTLSDISQELFDEEMKKSPTFQQAFQTGYSGERLNDFSERLMVKMFPYLPINLIKDRYLSQFNHPQAEIEVWQFKELDEKLPQSFVLHAFVAEKTGELYQKRNEGILFSRYDQAISEAIPNHKQAANVNLWLNYHVLLSRIKHYEVKSILRLTEKKDYQYAFSNFEELAKSLEPYAYFCGWQQRLEDNDQNNKRKYTLPTKYRSGLARQSVLSAYYYHQDEHQSKLEVLGKTLESIERTGNTDEIREYFAQLQAGAILRGTSRPFKTWEMKALKQSERIYEIIDEKLYPKSEVIKEQSNQHKATPETRAATSRESNVAVPPESKVEIPMKATEEPVQASASKASSKEKRLPQQERIHSAAKTPLELLKETLQVPQWSDVEFASYIYALLEGNESLLQVNRYPDSIETPVVWQTMLLQLAESKHTDSRRLLGIGHGKNELDFSPILPTGIPNSSDGFLATRNSEIDTFEINPVVADLVNAHQVSFIPREDNSIPLSQVHAFLRDKRKIPLLAVSMNDIQYLLFRTANSVSIPSNLPFANEEEFTKYWYGRHPDIRQSGVIERFFTNDDISIMSSSRDRRSLVKEICSNHQYALYQSTNALTYNRVV